MQQWKRNVDNGASEGLNHAVRRLWTTFRESGGDFGDSREVDELAGVVQNRVVILPPRQRWAFELVRPLRQARIRTRRSWPNSNGAGSRCARRRFGAWWNAPSRRSRRIFAPTVGTAAARSRSPPPPPNAR